MTGGRGAALFLDRDGVVIEDRGYVHRMEDVALVPGIGALCREAHRLGLAVVIVTNQSGIARGLFDEATHARFTEALLAYLARHGAVVDALYHCPHHPTAGHPPLRRVCDCRKPAPGLLRRAAADLGLSLERSVMVGDRTSDIEAAWRAGLGHAFLLAAEPDAGCTPSATCRSLDEVRRILPRLPRRNAPEGAMGRGPP